MQCISCIVFLSYQLYVGQENKEFVICHLPFSRCAVAPFNRVSCAEPCTQRHGSTADQDKNKSEEMPSQMEEITAFWAAVEVDSTHERILQILGKHSR